MADQILESVRDVAEGQIDFQGQRLADNIATYLLVIVGAISFLTGYILQDIKLALYIGLAGTAVAFVIVVPPWPFFNQNPVGWLPVVGQRRAETGTGAQGQAGGMGIVVDGKVVG